LAADDFERHSEAVRNMWEKLMEQGSLGEMAEFYEATLEIDFATSKGTAPLPRSGSFSSHLGQRGQVVSTDGLGMKHLDLFGRCLGGYQGALSRSDLHRLVADEAPAEFSNGMRSGHVLAMMKGAEAVARRGLTEEFTDDLKDSWDIVVVQGMGPSLCAALDELASTVSLISDSWTLARKNMTLEELGMAVYDKLFEAAPRMRVMFSQNQQIMATKLAEMLSMLVSCSSQMDLLLQQMSWIGYRHMTYGVKQAQVPVIGGLVISVIQSAVGEEDWSSDVQAAWEAVWGQANDAMMQAMILGEKHGHVMLKMMAASAQFSHEIETALERNLKATQVPMKGLEVLPCEDTFTSKSIRTGLLSRVKSTAGRPASSSSRAPLGTVSGLSTLVQPRTNSDKGNGKSSKSAALSLFSFINTCVDMMWRPEDLEEFLIIQATNTFKEGLTDEMLPGIGEALRLSFEDVLGRKEDGWGPEQDAAWEWMWGRISDTMGTLLKSRRDGHGEVLSEAWDLVDSKCSIDDIATFFWEELNECCPHIVHLFTGTRLTQVIHFKGAMNFLISSALNFEEFCGRLSKLAVSHMRFGVKSEYIQGVGDVFLGVLRRGLLEIGEWSDKVETAFSKVWSPASMAFARTLNNSHNKLSDAIVSGDAEQLQIALVSTPRSKRVGHLCAIYIKDEVLSPLVWAIQDGKTEIARYILRDVLTIRADRDGYYYGAEELFDKHPNLVGLLCRDAPHLLDALLDGLMWHSPRLPGDKIQVNYYLRHLYGNLEEHSNAFASTLSLMHKKAPVEIFYHPVIRQLLDVKWYSFAVYLFLCEQFWFAFILGWFLVLEIEFSEGCGLTRPRIVFTTLTMLTNAIMMGLASFQYYRGMTKKVPIGRYLFNVPYLLTTVWNLARFSSCVLLSIYNFLPCDFGCLVGDPDTATRSLEPMFRRATKSSSGSSTGGFPDTPMVAPCFTLEREIVAGLATLLLWVQAMQTFVVSKTLASLTYTLGIMAKDVFANVAIILVVTLSFGSALAAMRETPESVANMGEWIVILSMHTLTVDTFNFVNDVRTLGKVTIMVFNLIVNIGLLNVLIAQLSLTYQNLNDKKEGWALKHRAQVVTEIEAYMPLSMRRRYFERLKMHKPLEFLEGDFGPSGGMSVRLPAKRVQSHPKYVPNRIIRFTGPADPHLPWPVIIQM